MAHRSRMQLQKFPCNHRGFGKYCHFCKDVAAGKPVGRKTVKTAEGQTVAFADAKPRMWKKAKCPFCGGSRVKKNEINAFSALDAFEYSCTSYECGKQFNSDQVKEYDEVEVKQSRGPVERYNRLTD
ncbi:MAG: hypothetical protein HY716_07170 [Planctomycetes bacterium]|nr:hypothetical protein [Planctomycetota bacterium]